MLSLIITHNEDVFELVLEEYSTVDDLKLFIQSKIFIEPDYQFISYKGELFDSPGIALAHLLDKDKSLMVDTLQIPLELFKQKHMYSSKKQLFDIIREEKQPICSDYHFDDDSCMIVRIMEHDNSCLFSAIHYAMNQNRNDPSYLREYIGKIIIDNPLKWTSEILGSTPSNYKTMINKKSSWGGEIEIIILSQYFDIEILVISINPYNINRFGAEGHRKRIYLLYTGSHYNLLVRNFIDAKENIDVTIFSKANIFTLRAAEQASKKYMQKFSEEFAQDFACSVCDFNCKSKSMASAHGQETGHTLRSLS